jgi:hypothetical protein
MYDCVILAVLCAVPLMVFWHLNDETKDVERFFYEHDRQKYEILQISLFVLFIAFSLNMRYIISESATRGFNWVRHRVFSK